MSRLSGRLPRETRQWLDQVSRETKQRQRERLETISRFASLDAVGDPLQCAHPRPPHRRKVVYPDVAAADRAGQSLFDRFGGRRSVGYACPFGDHAHLTTARPS